MNSDEKLNLILENQNSLNKKIDIFLLADKCCVEWVSVSNVATLKGLTSDAIRKQLQNGNFEENVDFKYNGSRIQIHQGAIERIHRKRRGSNG